MIRNRYFAAIFYILAIGLIASQQGCGGGDTTKKDTPSVVKKRDLRDYIQASCAHEFSDGGGVGTTATLSDNASFGKRFESRHLSAVLRASAAETVRYIETTGARVYAIEESETGCEMFRPLQSAPGDFSSYWADASKDLEEGSFIVGLYVEKGTAAVQSSAGSAIIGVRRDASRWTLVHEFLHHLFQTARASGDVSSDRLHADFKAKVDQLLALDERYRSSPSADELRQLAPVLRDVSRLGRELLVRFSLEEVTIETLMQRQRSAGNLAYAPFSKDSSDGYISSSAGKANDLLDAIADFARKLDSDSLTFGLREERTIAQTIRQEVSTLKLDIHRVLGETGNQFLTAPRGTIQASATTEAEPHGNPGAPCAHSREADAAIDAAISALGRISR